MSKNNNNGSYDKPSYEVGYGKPPKDHQYKPGQSGNSKGRSKKKKDEFCDMVEDVFFKDETVQLKDRRITASAMKLAMMKVREIAVVKGDVKAIKIMMQLADKFGFSDRKMEVILPYIPSRTEMRAMDPDFNDDNL